ncbi:crAss001_48 related protein [Acinetobacter sp. 197]|uniref:crAss001_48 related protein n=1 Tax=Acinetobacter sp. 197 TaxID=3114696 RepID=UPI003A85034A
MSKKLLALTMVAFAGTSLVHAATMTRQEYNDYRGWQLPEGENGEDIGYIIEDRAGKKNTDELEGFVQWLPEDEFLRKFKPAPKNHIERMQSEKHELDTKLNALKAFLAKLGTDEAPLLTDEQVDFLEEQKEAMQNYSDVLGVRIEYDADLFKAMGD